MPKKTNFGPNERVDVPDMLRAANDYTAEVSSFELQNFALGDRSHLLNGFRIKIVNNSTPGQPPTVTIYNGHAYDKNGLHLNNEANPLFSKPFTLADGPNTTYFLEVVFTEDATDEDARAFWDPTIPNTAPIPNGKEVPGNITTRITPTWQIVDPVSTSAFDFSLANPNSVRIPLMRLRTDANNDIIAGSADNLNLAVVKPNAVLTADYDGVGTLVKVTDARLFSDVTTEVTFDPDSIFGAPVITNVASIDFANNILQLTGAIAAFTAGTVVRASGLSAQFVQRRKGGPVPTDPADHPDNASRLFQGNEDRGKGLSTDPDNAALRNDVEIQNLKDHVDFLAGQIREMKWGAQRVGDDESQNSRIPPQTFDLVNASPRYFDKSRGIQGAGTYSLTIGDGISSYGDFNGTDQVAFQAAVDAAQSGDTIFVKPGSYVFTATVNVSKLLTFVGDSSNSTGIVTTTDGISLFSVTNQTLRFYDMVLANTGDLHKLVNWDNSSHVLFVAERCTLLGDVHTNVGSVLSKLIIRDCVCVATNDSQVLFGSDSTPGSLQKCVIENTTFATVGDQCKLINFETIDELSFLGNHWENTDGTTAGTAASTGIFGVTVKQGLVQNNRVICLGARGVSLINITGQVDQLIIDGVNLDVTSGCTFEVFTVDAFIEIPAFSRLEVRNIYVEGDFRTLTANPAIVYVGVDSQTIVGGIANAVTVENIFCTFENTSSSPGIGVYIAGDTADNPIDSTVRNCWFVGSSPGLFVNHFGETLIEGNLIDGGSTGFNASYGVVVAGSATDPNVLRATIRDNVVRDVTASFAGSANVCRGIQLGPLVGAASPVSAEVYGNSITGTGQTLVISEGSGILVNQDWDYLNIHDNLISGVVAAGAGAANGILITGEQVTSTLDGISLHIHNNAVSNIGGEANFVVGIGTFADFGNGNLDNVNVHDNILHGLSSSSLANFGIVLRQTAGQIRNLHVNNNSVEISHNVGVSSPFGAGISIETINVFGLNLMGNHVSGDVINALSGVGTCYLLAPTGTATTTGGIWQNVHISNNTSVSDVDVNGFGTQQHILLLGVPGTLANTATVWSNLNITGNSTAGTNQTQDQTGFQHHIHVIGVPQGMSITGNNTVDLSGNRAVGAIRIECLVAGAGIRSTITGNTAILRQNGAIVHASPPVSFHNLDFFTVTGNVWHLSFLSTAAAGDLVKFLTCNDGTVTGNLIVGNAVSDGEVVIDNCTGILGVGNSFGGTQGSVTILGGSDNTWETGTMADIASVGALNWRGS